MTGGKNSGYRRLVAFALDWLVIALWCGVLLGAVFFLSAGTPRKFSGPWTAQAVGFLSLTLPVTLYFSFMESSRWRATLGKRIVGLRVSTISGERLGFGTAILRNGIRFVPWELGHVCAWQASYSPDGEIPNWLLAPLVLSMTLSLWWVGSLLFKNCAPYDRWTGTRLETGN